MSNPNSEHRFNNYNGWVEDKMHEMFQNIPMYENQKMYVIDFGLMPFFGGPAGLLILSAYLYPDLFSMDDAMKLTQEYINNFMPGQNDVNNGFTYTGSGYYSYKG